MGKYIKKGFRWRRLFVSLLLLVLLVFSFHYIAKLRFQQALHQFYTLQNAQSWPEYRSYLPKSFLDSAYVDVQQMRYQSLHVKGYELLEWRLLYFIWGPEVVAWVRTHGTYHDPLTHHIRPYTAWKSVHAYSRTLGFTWSFMEEDNPSGRGYRVAVPQLWFDWVRPYRRFCLGDSVSDSLCTSPAYGDWIEPYSEPNRFYMDPDSLYAPGKRAVAHGGQPLDSAMLNWLLAHTDTTQPLRLIVDTTLDYSTLQRQLAPLLTVRSRFDELKWSRPWSSEEKRVYFPRSDWGSMVSLAGNCDSTDSDNSSCLRPFFFDRFAVTLGEFRQVMGYTPFSDSLWDDSYPALHVNWFEAGQYCQKVGKRLPTYAEYEHADLGQRLDSRGSRYRPVGQYPANAHGIFDLEDDFREWTADCDGDCTSKTSRRLYNTGYESYAIAGNSYPNLGFRCAK